MVFGIMLKRDGTDNNRPDWNSNSRPLNVYSSALPTELSDIGDETILAVLNDRSLPSKNILIRFIFPGVGLSTNGWNDRH